LESTIPTEPVDYHLKSSVGGFLGINASDCHTHIHLEKKELIMGETINLRLNIDNSTCKADVKNVKIRIKQTMKGSV